MSAPAELRDAAETMRADWVDAEHEELGDWALSLAMLDLILESVDVFESLPKPIAARLLTLARLINGGDVS